MAKNSVRDFDATAANNTDIQSVDIAENCAPSGINNAIRELMADIKDVSTGTIALESPQADSMTVTGDLTVDTNTLYVDSTNNRVGLGTVSPSVNFHIVDADNNAQIRVENNDGIAKFQKFEDDLIVTNTDTGDIIIKTGTGETERLRVDSSGNVGIGTSSPTQVFEINNGSNTAAAIKVTDTSGYTELFFGDSADDDAGYVSYRHATNHMAFGVNASERMRIDSSGDLLVGKTTTAIGTAGSRFISNGQIQATASGNEPFFANRLSSDGVLFDFRKDGSTVGSISTIASTMYLGTGDVNLRLGASTDIRPVFSTGLNRDNAIDLGTSSARFKGLYIGDNIAHLDAAGNARVLYERVINTLGNVGTNVTCANLSKAAGSFKIDHPLESKSDTHHLVHSFVEAPQADNIYRGTVDLIGGSATINLDTEAGMTEGTFVALNCEVQCFTSNESGWTLVKGSVSGNALTITAQDNTCTDTISWLVIGERKDAHMLNTDWTDDNGKVIVEPLKPVDNENMENANG